MGDEQTKDSELNGSKNSSKVICTSFLHEQKLDFLQLFTNI